MRLDNNETILFQRTGARFVFPATTVGFSPRNADPALKALPATYLLAVIKNPYMPIPLISFT